MSDKTCGATDGPWVCDLPKRHKGMHEDHGNALAVGRWTR